MTAREYLLRRKRNAGIALAGAGIFLLVAMAVADRNLAPTRFGWWVAPLVVVVPLSLVAGFTAAWSLCPACQANLSNVRLRPRKKHQVNYCPYCALRLDDELPGSGAT